MPAKKKDAKLPAKRKPGPGRPLALTPEVQKMLLDATASGLKPASAAAVAGIGISTLRAYLAKGRAQKRGPLRAFLDAFKKARHGAFVQRHLLNIARIGLGAAVVERRTIVRKGRGIDPDETETVEKYGAPCWTASAWLLERCEPKLFALVQAMALKMAGKKGGKSYQLVIDDGPDEIPPPEDLPRE